ncbi:molybdopterin-converting factor chain 2 [Lysobacter enzymogenes]|uniref:molybdenum cofactor biosynthesis protein MoaE n=1 Tax=Lysobacter enzymogenes TaxID=69 RepID=UPI0019D17E01|nr:molybdenum cofactor biosynthesis protein MoaE [Lysobacter enzymogenes]MBN7138068.1 molybdopterin-converting factor chain 2 [Lysobacter enzymogenes]
MTRTDAPTLRFALSETAFELAPLRAALLSAQAGAYASFEGWVRDHHAGRAVLGLRYESYAELALSEGEKVLAEALERFAIVDARCVHRVGELAIGELAVWVGVSAAHRDAAFAACRYIIDETKARVPIWKHERYADGAADWLHPEPPAAG